jgi:hypothetical protein
MNDQKSFWATLPGILTGIAAVIGAIVGLLTILNQIGIFATKPPAVSQSPSPPSRDQPKQAAEKPTPQGETPQKTVPRASDSQLSGHWSNDNPQTRGITRLEVQQNGDLVAVHAWGACSPQDCDWGTEQGPVREQSASVTWDQGFVLRKMTLVPDGGRLRMVLDSVYRDSRPPQHGVEYFVRSP